MADRPEAFDCTMTDWTHIYELCQTVATGVRAAEFEPDVVVALARGGWVAGRICCDFLGIDDLVSLKIEHYVGTGQKGDEPRIRYPLPEGAVAGKNVLIVDEIADTGETLRRAREYVADRTDGAVRAGALQLAASSGVTPAFVGEQLNEWTWVIYPWNLIENLIDLTTGVLERSDRAALSEPELRHRLITEHAIATDAPQLDRLGAVIDEMARRELVTQVDDGRVRLA